MQLSALLGVEATLDRVVHERDQTRCDNNTIVRVSESHEGYCHNLLRYIAIRLQNAIVCDSHIARRNPPTPSDLLVCLILGQVDGTNVCKCVLLVISTDEIVGHILVPVFLVDDSLPRIAVAPVLE